VCFNAYRFSVVAGNGFFAAAYSIITVNSTTCVCPSSICLSYSLSSLCCIASVNIKRTCQPVRQCLSYDPSEPNASRLGAGLMATAGTVTVALPFCSTVSLPASVTATSPTMYKTMAEQAAYWLPRRPQSQWTLATSSTTQVWNTSPSRPVSVPKTFCVAVTHSLVARAFGSYTSSRFIHANGLVLSSRSHRRQHRRFFRPRRLHRQCHQQRLSCQQRSSFTPCTCQ